MARLSCLNVPLIACLSDHGSVHAAHHFILKKPGRKAPQTHDSKKWRDWLNVRIIIAACPAVRRSQSDLRVTFPTWRLAANVNQVNNSLLIW